MVLIGLLLIALVCLALGLVLASAGWLIGSLAASAAAAWVLWRGRDRIIASGAPTESAADNPPLASSVPQTASSVATSAPSRDAAVAETPAAADYARRRADELSAAGQPATTAPATTAPAATAAPAAAEAELVDVDVWVIDGRPNYHTAHCGVLLGADAETIPHSQAVEDGFTPCTLCDPDAHPERVAQPAQAAAPTEAGEPGDLQQVWVVDGWPHYHAQGCARLSGAESEAIPFGQAVEDGFTPCPNCQPAVIEPAPVRSEAVASEPASEPAAEPAPVAAAEPVAQTAAPVTEPAPMTEPEPAVVEAEPVTAATPTVAPETAEAPVAEAVPAEAPTGEPEPGAAEEPAGAEPAPAASGGPGDVWVVPGRPRFHLQDCMIIGDQGAIAVPLAQAVDDGFKPCSLCEPV
jgi:hypothetical protein